MAKSLSVFHGCSVVGYIAEGMLHFESMSKDYDIVLSMEPYAVSTGYLDEAMEFIETCLYSKGSMGNHDESVYNSWESGAC